MTASESRPGRPVVANVAFYLLLALGILSLAGSPWNPGGLIQGPLFLIAALGIWRQRSWSAYGLAILLLALSGVPLLDMMFRGTHGTDSATTIAIIFAGCFILGISILLFFAGRALERNAGRRGMAWPWISASIVLAAFFLLFGVFQMPTGSMEKTLLIGDRIAVWRTHGRTPGRGEVVVHYYPVNRNDVFVKRVVAIPGDRVRIVNKRLFVNGAAVQEPYVEHTTEYIDSYRDNFPSAPNVPLYPQAQQMIARNVENGEVVVPPGHYFVLGDNRDTSLDSRYWGFIESSDIIGTPKFVYYSAPPAARQPGRTGLPIANIRWSRLFHPVS